MTSDARRNELRVAIVGAGNIARTFHIPTLVDLGVHIDCVIDPSEAALQSIAKLVPSSVKLIRSTELNLPAEATCALVCSPSAMHASQVREILRSDRHVLCEKPLALRAAEARELAAFAGERRLVLQVGYYRRFHRASQAVWQLLRSGELGRPISCAVRAGHVYNNIPASMLRKSLAGGGVLADFGVHVIDRIISWADAVEVDAYSDDGFSGLEANAVLTLRARIGDVTMPATMLLSRTNELGYCAQVDFEAASIVNHLNEGHRLTLTASKPARVFGQDRRLSHGVELELERPIMSFFKEQWKEFSSRIRGGAEVVSSLAGAVRTTEIVEEAYARRTDLSFASAW